MEEVKELEHYVDKMYVKLAALEVSVWSEIGKLNEEVWVWKRVAIVSGLANLGWVFFFLWLVSR